LGKDFYHKFSFNKWLSTKKLVNAGEQKIKINLETEAAGIYTAVLSGGSKRYSGKIVFE
jgi:hypothetical protein